MLVKELDGTIIDALGNGLSDLVGTPSLDHVQLGPTVFGFSARGRAYKEAITKLALEVVLLDMIGEERRYLPIRGSGHSPSLKSGSP
jgi:hypothetical protein